MIPYNQNIALQILSSQLQKQVDENEYLNNKILKLEQEVLRLKEEKNKVDWLLIDKGLNEALILLEIDSVLKGLKDIENVKNLAVKLILASYNLTLKENINQNA